MIAIKMVFAGSDKIFEDMINDGPFIVPLAVPLVAGPSSIATVMLLMAKEPARWLEWLLALFCAWLGAGIILLFSDQLSVLLGDRILKAVERLMGMILTAVAVEMLVNGIHKAFFS